MLPKAVTVSGNTFLGKEPKYCDDTHVPIQEKLNDVKPGNLPHTLPKHPKVNTVLQQKTTTAVLPGKKTSFKKGGTEVTTARLCFRNI